MNDIDSMPPKCHDCPYWEICEEPYICPTQDEKKELKQEDKQMDCPWYLGLEATEECLKTCTITNENRDNSICPESTSADDCYLDET